MLTVTAAQIDPLKACSLFIKKLFIDSSNYCTFVTLSKGKFSLEYVLLIKRRPATFYHSVMTIRLLKF